jgi:hypothetical protein
MTDEPRPGLQELVRIIRELRQELLRTIADLRRENADLRRKLEGFADRIAVQAELLRRRAERPPDGPPAAQGGQHGAGQVADAPGDLPRHGEG